MQTNTLLLKDRIRFFTRYYKKNIIVCTLLLIAFIGSLSFAELMDLPKWMLEKICDTSTLNSVNELVSIEIGSDTIGGFHVPGLQDILNNINNMAIYIAMMLAIVVFMIELAETSTRANELSLIVCVMPFVRLVIALIMITKSLSMCTGIANLGTAFATEALGAVTVSEYNYDAIVAQMDEEYHKFDNFEPETDAEGLGVITQAFENMWGRIDNLRVSLGNKISVFVNYTLALALPCVGMTLSWVFVKLTCMERAVEIIVLAALSPIAFCLMGNEHFMHTTGVRFLKQMCALCLQGAVLVIIIGICSNIMVGQIAGTIAAGSSKDLGNAAFNCLTIGIMMMGISGKSLSISQKLVGLG